MVYIVPKKFKKKTLPNSLLHRITIMEYTVENTAANHLIEQTAYLVSEHTRSCTAEGEPGK